jgi:ParB-like chromosome segregation protein Spo0J
MGSTRFTTKALPIRQLRLDGDTRGRVDQDREVILEYAALMEAGVQFPPVVAFFDGENYWLVDGFHRWHAANRANIDKLPCEVRKGTLVDARWFSYSANKAHGLRRTTADKRRATIAALKHPNGAKLSDNQIAEHVGVSDKTVTKYRAELESASEIPKVTERTGRDGKTYDTSNIGKAKAAEPEPEAAPTLSVHRKADGPLRWAHKPETVESKSQDAEPESATVVCPYCGNHEADEDGDCTKCHEPEVVKAKPKANRHLRTIRREAEALWKWAENGNHGAATEYARRILAALDALEAADE